jgi:hypothetical protein
MMTLYVLMEAMPVTIFLKMEIQKSSILRLKQEDGVMDLIPLSRPFKAVIKEVKQAVEVPSTMKRH